MYKKYQYKIKVINGKFAVVLDRGRRLSAKILSEHLNKQDIVLEKILIQASNTNGRVTKLEDKTSDYEEIKNQIKIVSDWKIEFMAEIKGMKRVMILLVIILPSLISTIFILYINNLKQNIINDASASVLSSIESKYDIKVIQ